MTKIDIISGFLGAGKTTLIKKLLAEAFQGEKLVLIENEFGEISIDGGFLKESGVQISEMSSGCICCSLVGDFNKALKDVQAQFHPDRILIEPSGVGKLSDVIVAVENTVADTEDMKLNSFVTVADATKVKVYMKNFGEFYNNQIEAAGTVLLSRTQKLNQEKLDAAVAMLREKNPDAAILTTPWDQLDRQDRSSLPSRTVTPWPTSCWRRCGRSTPRKRRSMSTSIITTTIMTMRSTSTTTIMTTITRSMSTTTTTTMTCDDAPLLPAITIIDHDATRCSPPGAGRRLTPSPRRTSSASSPPWTPVTTARSSGPRASFPQATARGSSLTTCRRSTTSGRATPTTPAVCASSAPSSRRTSWQSCSACKRERKQLHYG